MPDRDLLDAKIESLRRCLRRIADHRPETAEALVADYDTQDIIAINLQRAVQLCVDLGGHLIASRGWDSPATMSRTFDVLLEHGAIPPELAVRLRGAVGFRNISVHEYDKIDWARVHALITTGLEDFRAFASAVNRECSTAVDSESLPR